MGHVSGDESRPSRIAMFSLGSKEYEILPVEGAYPIWLSDGRRVLFHNEGKLLVLDVETGRIKEILAGVGLDHGFALSHDDRTIWFGITRREADIWMVTLDEDPRP
jgi:hypothetical protein